MQWNVGDFDIVRYDGKATHYKFVRELILDPVIFEYFKNAIMKECIEGYHSEELTIKQAYLVARMNELVGYLYLGNCDFNGVLSLDYALHQHFRGQHIGSHMLKEVSEGLIANMGIVNNMT